MPTNLRPRSPGSVKNCMAVPCKTFDGKVAGVLVVTNKIGEHGGDASYATLCPLHELPTQC
jgi:hypothetical protein